MDSNKMNASTLLEIRGDLKEIKNDFSKLQVELTEIRSKMPTMAKVQELEVKVNTLHTQFKVVWAAMGAIGIVAIASVVANFLRLLGLQ